jgi:hypothetical protein
MSLASDDGDDDDLKRRNHFGDEGINGRIILNCILDCEVVD